MNRDDVLREFGITDVGEITTRYEDMADEIVHLRRNNRALREALRKEQDNALHTSYTLSAEHQRAERILAALREPSDFVIEAIDATAWDQGCARLGLPACALVARAAVAAAEREVAGE